MGKKFIDDEGKEWDMSEFDDTRSWSKPKKEKRPKVKRDNGFYGHTLCQRLF